MAWIKMEIGLPDKPEVLQIADTMGISPEEVCGYLLRLWGWAHNNTEDGMIITKLDFIDHIVRKKGFCQALVDVNWLQTKGEFVTIPNWDRHNGKGAKERALDAERKRVKRSQ